MFPSTKGDDSGNWAPWDEKREYYTSNLVVYVETRHQRLLKCGKELPLTDVIARAVKMEGDQVQGQGQSQGKIVDGVVMKDGLMSFIVLPKGQVEKKWIEEYKLSRDRAGAGSA